MMVRSSVQQDPRAPGDRWHRTPIVQPLEGALTSCPVQVSTTVVSCRSTNSLLIPQWNCPALPPRLLHTPWPIRKQQNWDHFFIGAYHPALVSVCPATYLNGKKDRNVGMSLYLCQASLSLSPPSSLTVCLGPQESDCKAVAHISSPFKWSDEKYLLSVSYFSSVHSNWLILLYIWKKTAANLRFEFC